MSFRKQFAFFAVFFGLWQSLAFGVSKSGKVFIYDGTQRYLFTSSYNLHTESEPNDLKVDMIVEYKIKNNFELRFKFNNRTRKIVVYNDEKLGIGGLNAVKQSIWFPALEKIAENIRQNCCGKNLKHKTILSKQKNDISSECIEIQSLKKHKLHSACDLDTHLKKIEDPRNLQIDVEEEMYHGKKQVVATASFEIEKYRFGAKISFLKFIKTQNGIKPISLVSIKRSSIWYPTIKKEVQKSFSRYLRLTRTHNKVIGPVKKVDPTSLQGSFKPNEIQNTDDEFLMPDYDLIPIPTIKS